jgi:hypothetical protein
MSKQRLMPLVALFAIVGIQTLGGQWLHQPGVAIPRTADGKPDLGAPAPRAADGRIDFSGVWNRSAGQFAADITVGMNPSEIQKWVQELYQQRIDRYAKDNMGVQCLPDGPRYATKSGYVKIIQTPLLIVVLHEDLSYRQIFLDGRPLPLDSQPSFMGYSVGHWEEDTFVVQSAGFNARTWLDGTGHAHTEALRLTERYRRADFGHLSIEVTLDDPGAYGKPWTVRIEAALQPDTDLLEYVCLESDGGKEHFVGDLDQDRARSVSVDPSVLASYVGAYDITIDGAKLILEVTLVDGQLMVNRGGRGPQPMVPTSQTVFSTAVGNYEFQKDEKGDVAYILYGQVESEIRGVRRSK